MSDAYARTHGRACDALVDFRDAGGHAERIVDTLEEHIAATAEAGVIARLRSKLALLPDSPAKFAISKLLED